MLHMKIEEMFCFICCDDIWCHKDIFNSNKHFFYCYQEVTISEILMVTLWKLSLKNLY